VLLDFVPNHTSHEHAWFRQSRSSRENPYRSWYLWRDPAADGGPPNNWQSVFGGSAWELDRPTGQYYLHSYLKEQPDLNWRNADVREAMQDVLRFWLERGVSGFRVDAISRLIKDAAFRDNPPNPYYDATVQAPYHAYLPVYSADQPETAEVVTEMRKVLDEYGDTMMIGEAYLPLERVIAYYDAGVHFAFNFQLIKLPWTPKAIARAVDCYEHALRADQWPNWVLGNHDNHRVATRAGVRQTRLAAMLLTTLRGTPTMYYGDEVGMQDVDIPPELVQDPWEKNVPGLGLGRDGERTPMQWNSTPGAGFTTGRPWLPIGCDLASANVAVQREDGAALLNLYRALLSLRRESAALHSGSWRLLSVDERHFAYARELGKQHFTVALNFSMHRCEVSLGGPGRIALSTLPERRGEVASPLVLEPEEGVIVALGAP